MRETQRGQSETQVKLTLDIPMSNAKQYDKALDLFRHIDGSLPNMADSLVVNDTYLNDAAYSCIIRPNLAEGPGMETVGIKMFLGNSEEGFESAQMYVDTTNGAMDHEVSFLPNSNGGEFTEFDALTAWLTEQMTTATHPFFKAIGMRPLVLDSIDKVTIYQKALTAFGLSYHMDDSVWDCLREQDFSVWERVLLHYYHCACWQTCKVEQVDVHSICWDVYQTSGKDEVAYDKLIANWNQESEEWRKTVEVWKTLPELLKRSIEE